MLGHLHREMMSVIFAPVNHQHPTGFQGHKELWGGCECYGRISQLSFSRYSQSARLMCYYGQAPPQSLQRSVLSTPSLLSRLEKKWRALVLECMSPHWLAGMH